MATCRNRRDIAGDGDLVLLYLPRGLDPVLAGHTDVHEHHVGAVLAGEGRCFVPVGGLAEDGHVISRVHEDSEPASHEGLVIGDDDADARSATSLVGMRARTHDLPWPLHEVGALLEARAIHPGRSGRAHLEMLAQTNHIPTARVEEVLDMVGLSSVARRRAGKFSSGMTQRLGIAAASPPRPAARSCWPPKSP